MPQHVILLGHASVNNSLAAMGLFQRDELPPDTEIWCCNNPPGWVRSRGIPVDRYFQIHQRFSLSEAEENWVKECSVPLYVTRPEEYTDGKNVVEYPYKEVFSMPGVPGTVLGERARGEKIIGGLLTCSFAWMIALACYFHHKVPSGAARLDKLALCGVELQGGSTRERLVEYPGVLWWLGYAAGIGIQVETDPKSELLWYPHAYGHDYYEEGDFARKRVLGWVKQHEGETKHKWWVSWDRKMKARAKRRG